MIRNTVRIVALSLLVSLPFAAFAHGVRTTVTFGSAVTAAFTAEDGTPLAAAPCTIFAPDDSAPYHTGTTDPHGRMAFVPDRPGIWRVRAATADGHGAEVAVEVGDDLVVAQDGDPDNTVLRGVAVIVVVLAAVLVARRRAG